MFRGTPKHLTQKLEWVKSTSPSVASAYYLFKSRWLPIIVHGPPLSTLLTSSSELNLKRKTFSSISDTVTPCLGFQTRWITFFTAFLLRSRSQIIFPTNVRKFKE
uniref:Uncharacterized protein n=1 Tax=Opuntia streptacantha TaxID=393608 RepID=A0A7C9DLP1_OPUST